jgi:putative aminopeptidase FrvX
VAFETGALLQELLATYGPCGEEDAVREVCRRELEPLVDETWVDAAGNLVGLLRGGEPGPGVPAIRVMAHMDELSMVVKRVEDGGRRHMAQLGTMYPANFGLGPVAVLGGRETLTAVLALGSEHTTQETQHGWQVKPDRGDQALDWLHVYVFTGRTADELREAGVHPGTRACIHRSKRTLVRVGPHLGSYFIDDRAALTTVLAAAAAIRETGRRPPGDVYLVFTTSEETGGVGAAYASHALPGDVTLALDVGPVEAEYQVRVDSGLVVSTRTRPSSTTRASPTTFSTWARSSASTRPRPSSSPTSPTPRTRRRVGWRRGPR